MSFAVRDIRPFLRAFLTVSAASPSMEMPIYEAHSCNALDARESQDLFLHVGSLFFDLLQEIVVYTLKNCQRACACHRVAAVCSAVISRLQHIAAFFSEYSVPPIGRPPPMPLANVTISGFTSKIFVCETACRFCLYRSVPHRLSAVCLSLCIVFSAALTEFSVERHHAAFALYHLHHDGTYAVRCSQYFQDLLYVVGVAVFESAYETESKK